MTATGEVESVYRQDGLRLRRARYTLAATAVLLAVAGCSAATTSASPSAPTAAPASSAPTPSSAPSLPAHDLSGQILFTRTIGNDEHITFVANADGSGECALQIPPGDATGCILAGARRILLFIPDAPNSATGTAATMGVDGSDYTVLPISDPTLVYVPDAFSPDGTRIAFEAFDESDPSRNGLYTARIDGSDIVRVTSHDGPQYDQSAAYSPDGTQIVFYRAPGDDILSTLGGTLWIINADGSGATPIEAPGVMPSSSARWSPDGTKILFSTARAQSTGALWTVDAEGSNLTKIFQDADPRYAHGRYATGPVWSPDGSQIMFTMNPIADFFQHPANGIYVMNADGTGLSPVLGGSDFKSMAEWWP